MPNLRWPNQKWATPIPPGSKRAQPCPAASFSSPSPGPTQQSNTDVIRTSTPIVVVADSSPDHTVHDWNTKQRPQPDHYLIYEIGHGTPTTIRLMPCHFDAIPSISTYNHYSSNRGRWDGNPPDLILRDWDTPRARLHVRPHPTSIDARAQPNW